MINKKNDFFVALISISSFSNMLTSNNNANNIPNEEFAESYDLRMNNASNLDNPINSANFLSGSESDEGYYSIFKCTRQQCDLCGEFGHDSPICKFANDLCPFVDETKKTCAFCNKYINPDTTRISFEDDCTCPGDNPCSICGGLGHIDVTCQLLTDDIYNPYFRLSFLQQLSEGKTDSEIDGSEGTGDELADKPMPPIVPTSYDEPSKPKFSGWKGLKVIVPRNRQIDAIPIPVKYYN